MSNSSLSGNTIIKKRISSIKINDTFKTIFPAKKDLIESIAKDMELNGFDYSQPLILWAETGELIDGHTRLASAKSIGLKAVPVIYRSFEDEEQVIEYEIKLQTNRRNLTDGELFSCISKIDKRNSHGGDRKSSRFKSSYEHLISDEGKSREELAELVGTSATKIQKVRTLLDLASEALKESIMAGEISLNKAYIQVSRQKKDNHDYYSGADEKPDISHKMNKKSLLARLQFYGYSTSEISKLLKIKRDEIEREIENIDKIKISDDYKNGIPVKDIAKHNDIDELLVWKYGLDNNFSDLEIFNQFGKSKYSTLQPKLGDVWNFARIDERLGMEYEGRASGQTLINILYRFSKQGDLVVDPMAGGGTTNDACLIMNRQCRSYDIHPARPDIIENDIIDGIPLKNKKADLVILDPPYFKKKKYKNPEIMKDRKTFINFLSTIASESYKILKKNKYVALLFGQYLDYENESGNITVRDLINAFEDKGFRHTIQINTPLSMHNQYQPYKIDYAKSVEPWRILSHSCNVEIFKKV